MRQGAAGSSLQGGEAWLHSQSISVSGKLPNEVSENKGPETAVISSVFFLILNKDSILYLIIYL